MAKTAPRSNAPVDALPQGRPAEDLPPPDGDAQQRPTTFLAMLADKWQLPLLIVAMLLVMTGLPRLLHTPPPVVDLQALVSEARQALAEGRPGEAVRRLDALTAQPLDEDTRAQAALIRGLAFHKLAEIDAPISRGEHAAAAIAALDEALLLAGRIENLDKRLTSPADFSIRLAQARMWAGQEAQTDLVEAIERSRIGQESIRRQAVDLLVKADSPAAATQIDAILQDDDLSPADRLWMTQRKCRLLALAGQLEQAEQILYGLLDQLASGDSQDAVEVQLAGNYYQKSQSSGMSGQQRDRLLDRAYLLLMAVQLRRSPEVGQEEVDAELNWLVGEVSFAQDRPAEAEEAFSRVLRLYPDTEFARISRLGLAKASAVYRPVATALEAYEKVVRDLLDDSPDPRIDPLAVRAALLALADQLRGQMHWEPAWKFLTLLYPLIGPDDEKPSRADVRQMQGDLMRRLASDQKQQADRLTRVAPPASQPDQAGWLIGRAREHLKLAAEAYLDSARLLSADDNRSGDNLERAAECFDEAGETLRAIVVLRKFIDDYPTDEGRIARAVFNLAKAYQAAEQFEQAIALYTRMTVEYANSPDANKSRVPMAQCHKALGNLDEAERILAELLADDLRYSPDSTEYRQALFELARLKYERGRYRQAIPRFDEALQRDSDSPMAVYNRYFLADSYRLSGIELDSLIARAQTAVERQQLSAARTGWLRQASAQFGIVITQFESRASAGPLSELDWLYLRNSYFFRADCVFDLGQYEQAIDYYDMAAIRYRDQPEAVAAYVQIVNCYLRMNRPQQARAANERARWMLDRLPADEFARRPMPVDKRFFATWLEWAGRSGMW